MDECPRCYRAVDELMLDGPCKEDVCERCLLACDHDRAFTQAQAT